MWLPEGGLSLRFQKSPRELSGSVSSMFSFVWLLCVFLLVDSERHQVSFGTSCDVYRISCRYCRRKICPLLWLIYAIAEAHCWECSSKGTQASQRKNYWMHQPHWSGCWEGKSMWFVVRRIFCLNLATEALRVPEGFFLLISGFLHTCLFPSSYSHITLILYINKLFPSFFSLLILRFLNSVMLWNLLLWVQSVSVEACGIQDPYV